MLTEVSAKPGANLGQLALLALLHGTATLLMLNNPTDEYAVELHCGYKSAVEPLISDCNVLLTSLIF